MMISAPSFCLLKIQPSALAGGSLDEQAPAFSLGLSDKAAIIENI